MGNYANRFSINIGGLQRDANWPDCLEVLFRIRIQWLKGFKLDAFEGATYRYVCPIVRYDVPAIFQCPMDDQVEALHIGTLALESPQRKNSAPSPVVDHPSTVPHFRRSTLLFRASSPGGPRHRAGVTMKRRLAEEIGEGAARLSVVDYVSFAFCFKPP